MRGFKCFLVPSGVDEFPAVSEGDLRQALPILARRGVPLLVHAEDPSRHHRNRPARRYRAYLASRPASSELDAIRLMIRLAEEFQTRVHVVHVSSAEGVEAIAGARAAWVPITAETCPHYLTFAAEEIPDGATAFKCAPPIREAAHRRALWDGLASGALDLIATDHSPAPPALKTPGDFVHAWGGIASLELSLPAIWTSLKAQLSASTVERSELTPFADLARWMSAAPAALAGLGDRKGRIAEGLDADLVVWDPDEEFVVDRGPAAAASQADSLCRAVAVRDGPHHVRARRAGVGQEQARARVRRPPAMSAPFLDLVDLASERLGAAVVAANDEFFAPKENLIKAAAPVWREGEYTERGKWMDGWETRRRRDLGPDAHDWCIVRLGARGIVRGVDVHTAFFTGNYPESCAIDACDLPGIADGRGADAVARGARSCRAPPLEGDAHNLLVDRGCGSRRRTCGSGSFRTAAWRGSASTVKSWPTGIGCGVAAMSTWPRSSMAAPSSRAATCSTDRGTT